MFEIYSDNRNDAKNKLNDFENYDNFDKLEDKNKKILLCLKSIGGYSLIREVLRFTIPIEKIEEIEPYYAPKNYEWMINFILYNIGKNGEKLNSYFNYIKEENDKIVQKYLNFSIEELKREFDKNDIYSNFHYEKTYFEVDGKYEKEKDYYLEKFYDKNIKVESILPSSIIFYYISNNLEEDEIVNFCLDYRIKELVKKELIFKTYIKFIKYKEYEKIRKYYLDENYKTDNFETIMFTLDPIVPENKEKNGETEEEYFRLIRRPLKEKNDTNIFNNESELLISSIDFNELYDEEE